METRTVTLDTADGSMPLYEAEPDGPPRGAVVVVQEAFGVNGHIEDVTRRFASAGYHAVAPHLFHRTGSPNYGYDDFTVVIPHILALSDEGSSPTCGPRSTICDGPAGPTARSGSWGSAWVAARHSWSPATRRWAPGSASTAGAS
jgi:hypothetical protein